MFIRSILILFAVFFIPNFALSDEKDPPSIHNMILLGGAEGEPFYIYHLSMFYGPRVRGPKVHAYQGVWQVNFKKDGKNADAEVRDHIKKNKKEFKLFSIGPEKFVLPELGLSKKEFKADLFAGHLESQVRDLLEKEITVVVKDKPIHFHSFAKATKRTDPLTYFSFGKKPTYLAKWQTIHPDKDQLLVIDKELDHNTKVLIPKRKDTKLLEVDEKVEAHVGDKKVNFKILSEYFTEGVFSTGF